MKRPVRRIVSKIKRYLKRQLAPNMERQFQRYYVGIGKHEKIKLASRTSLSKPEPWLSVVIPLYNTKKSHFEDLTASIQSQNLAGVEVILTDDGSNDVAHLDRLQRFENESNFSVLTSAQNTGIAANMNRGLAATHGRWVTFVDHDDMLAPHAISVLYLALQSAADQLQFLYTDEVLVDEVGKITGPAFKPAFDPILLSGMNYINHLSLYRRERLLAMGGFRSEFDGSQDYDAVLRYTKGLTDQQIAHLPYPAYFWRASPNSFSRAQNERSIQAARQTLRQHFANSGQDVTVGPALNPELHRVDFPVENDDWPSIAIILPSREKLSLITTILDGLYNNTDYPNFKVVVVDNGSQSAEVLGLYKDYEDKYPDGFSALVREETFNFARSVNRGIASVEADHYLILNNDVEVIDPLWLKELVSCLSYENVGIVGAKLIYEDHMLQHAGVIVGKSKLAGHWYLMERETTPGTLGRLRVRGAMSCVTGAVLLISGDCLKQIGPWDEEHFAVAYNDVDYCMRAHKAGLRLVWTPYARLYHHESLSRGSDHAKKNAERFGREKANLTRLHRTDIFKDPVHNPNFKFSGTVPKLKLTPDLHSPRHWFEN